MLCNVQATCFVQLVDLGTAMTSLKLGVAHPEEGTSRGRHKYRVFMEESMQLGLTALSISVRPKGSPNIESAILLCCLFLCSYKYD